MSLPACGTSSPGFERAAAGTRPGRANPRASMSVPFERSSPGRVGARKFVREARLRRGICRPRKERTMRICIPTENDQGLDSRLCGHFGSAPYFALADTDSGEVTIEPNSARHHSHGQCAPVDRIDVNRTDAVVCQGMGKRAYSSFQRAGVEILITSGTTVRDVLSEAGERTLQSLSLERACGGHGGSHRHHRQCADDS
jgi:predicted Fe-Mo cluster-binding NifX family protein